MISKVVNCINIFAGIFYTNFLSFVTTNSVEYMHIIMEKNPDTDRTMFKLVLYKSR